MHPNLLPAITALSDARHTATTYDHKFSWSQCFTLSQIAACIASKERIAPHQGLTALDQDTGMGMGILGIARARGVSSVQLGTVEGESETSALLLSKGTHSGAPSGRPSRSSDHKLPVPHDRRLPAPPDHGFLRPMGQGGPAFQPLVRDKDFLSLHQPYSGVVPLPAFDIVFANQSRFKMSLPTCAVRTILTPHQITVATEIADDLEQAQSESQAILTEVEPNRLHSWSRATGQVKCEYS